jgi:hypothetical protein
VTLLVGFAVGQGYELSVHRQWNTALLPALVQDNLSCCATACIVYTSSPERFSSDPFLDWHDTAFRRPGGNRSTGLIFNSSRSPVGTCAVWRSMDVSEHGSRLLALQASDFAYRITSFEIALLALCRCFRSQCSTM